MKPFCLVLVMFLSACTTVPVTSKFPNAVPELMKKCEDLKKVTGEKVLITDMLKVVIQNYSLYYECSAKVEGWQDWYTEQKKIHERAKK